MGNGTRQRRGLCGKGNGEEVGFKVWKKTIPGYGQRFNGRWNWWPGDICNICNGFVADECISSEVRRWGVPKVRGVDAEGTVGEFMFGCKRWKRKTEVLRWASFARWFDIDEFTKILWFRRIKKIMCDGDYFVMYPLLNVEPVKGFKCWSKVGMFWGAGDSDLTLNNFW